MSAFTSSLVLYLAVYGVVCFRFLCHLSFPQQEWIEATCNAWMRRSLLEREPSASWQSLSISFSQHSFSSHSLPGNTVIFLDVRWRNGKCLLRMAYQASPQFCYRYCDASIWMQFSIVMSSLRPLEELSAESEGVILASSLVKSNVLERGLFI